MQLKLPNLQMVERSCHILPLPWVGLQQDSIEYLIVYVRNKPKNLLSSSTPKPPKKLRHRVRTGTEYSTHVVLYGQYRKYLHSERRLGDS
jgi:hypothetical protein